MEDALEWNATNIYERPLNFPIETRNFWWWGQNCKYTPAWHV